MDVRKIVETTIYLSFPVWVVAWFVGIFFPNEVFLITFTVVCILELLFVEVTKYYWGWFDETKTFFGKKESNKLRRE
jgi:hypothetical protein